MDATEHTQRIVLIEMAMAKANVVVGVVVEVVNDGMLGKGSLAFQRGEKKRLHDRR